VTESDGCLRIEADAILFGFPSTRAALTVRPRTPTWRATGAAMRFVAGVALAGVVAIVPPHAPWLIGALVGGAVMARRRWIERYTLESAEGTCPKCGEPMRVKRGRLRTPHPVACESCHHESSLRIDAAALEG